MTPYKYHIRLSGKDKQVLRALTRAWKTARCVADRARIVLWTAAGITVDEIARPLEVHRSTAIHWRRWYLERRAAGLSAGESLQDRPRSGRPPKFTPYVICADERSGLQVLTRHHPTLPPMPGQPGRYEFEYERQGTLAYLAALDVFSGRVLGRVDDTVGIVPFGKLVDLVMGQAPYDTADRVFWIVDGGSSHHPSTSPARLQAAYANVTVVRLPTHASWLNQIEIYFSILTRKALTPMDLPHKQAVKERILGFQERYNETAKPFRWNFTRDDLLERLKKVAD